MTGADLIKFIQENNAENLDVYYSNGIIRLADVEIDSVKSWNSEKGKAEDVEAAICIY